MRHSHILVSCHLQAYTVIFYKDTYVNTPIYICVHAYVCMPGKVGGVDWMVSNSLKLCKVEPPRSGVWLQCLAVHSKPDSPSVRFVVIVWLHVWCGLWGIMDGSHVSKS